MAYTHEDLKQQLLDYVNTNPGWNWAQWNDETYWLGLHHKFDAQLEALQVMYGNKLKRIYAHYKEIFDILKYGVSESFIQATSEDDIIDLKAIKTKVMRIARKWRGVNAEIEGRSRGFFGPGCTYDRTYHGTDYYIDFNAGNNGNTGLSIAQAWLTLEQFTSTTARSAGDRAFIRANTSELPGATINCDEDGTADAPIYIIGCDSVTHDPWSDADNTLPIIDFNSNAREFFIWTDNHWQIERAEFVGGSSKNVHVGYGWGFRAIDCKFNDGGSIGLHLDSQNDAELIGCEMSGNASYGTLISKSGGIKFDDCDFDGGAGSVQDYGISIAGTDAEVIDSRFGQVNSHSVADLYFAAAAGGMLKSRNCTWDNNTPTWGAYGESGILFSEDFDGTKGANRIAAKAGTVTKDTGVTRVGGADSSAKMEPSSSCGLTRSITLCGKGDLIAPPFKIWTAAALTTITVYVRAKGTWGTYPTASELYLEASYLSHATSAARTKVQSNDVLNHASNWIAFDVTFTPLQAGFVYLNVFLKKYEDAGDGCYVDIKPVVS